MYTGGVGSDQIIKGLPFSKIFFFLRKEKIIFQGQNQYPASLSVTADTNGGGKGKGYQRECGHIFA